MMLKHICEPYDTQKFNWRQKSSIKHDFKLRRLSKHQDIHHYLKVFPCHCSLTQVLRLISLVITKSGENCWVNYNQGLFLTRMEKQHSFPGFFIGFKRTLFHCLLAAFLLLIPGNSFRVVACRALPDHQRSLSRKSE